MTARLPLWLLFLLLSQPLWCFAQGRVYKAQIQPHWFGGQRYFWYRNELPDKTREFILVDAQKGVRRPAFDHQKLARALGLPRADRLPLKALQFDLEKQTLTFSIENQHRRWSLTSQTLEKLAKRSAKPADDHDGLPPLSERRRSGGNGSETTITFVNRTKKNVRVFWLDQEGEHTLYHELKPGEEKSQHTFANHAWEILDQNDHLLAAFLATEDAARAVITDDLTPPKQPQPRSAPSRPDRRSPDKKWRAFVRDHQLFIRSEESGEEIQLSRDGRENARYVEHLLWWSPDSQNLVAARVTPGDQRPTYWIESSPKNQGRAKLHSRNYALPGDKMDSHHWRIFNIAERKQHNPQVDPIDFGRAQLRWRDDDRFIYEQTDRGHQRFRILEIDSRTGESRTLLEETSKTFIWSAHGPHIRQVTYFENSDEALYVSERDGWRHLYWVDLEKGGIARQITKGPWVVRKIDHIDSQKKQIWFRGGGFYPDQNPYSIHFFRVNFDGSELTPLTSGDGDQRIQYSPDRRHLIASYSRVDQPPRHELRRVSDGKKLCDLEQADVSELRQNGWAPPEAFSAKGRDGKTDIWGIICKPKDFDPRKKYPVLEAIYAGPHDSHAPKSFSPSRRYQDLTELGFIVVKLDGMGTANRSKAFHDVCWKNLKDAGFPDRIAWMKAAAKDRPYMDLERVGIYGTSAGGQNAAAAVLFHPQFYKAAFAACGCHDNRMDKASWNEQWMGFPVGPHYAKNSNIENAHRLEGKLFLLVGELDKNVPPESTLRFVDALIKADKDFEMLVMPGAGHTNGGAYGRKRMHDFFVRHLQP